jgi:hypothetical protein
MREAEVDGDAAPLFFFQTVGVDSGQRFHQRCLAMIDMPSRPYNDRFHLAGILPERISRLEKAQLQPRAAKAGSEGVVFGVVNSSQISY